MGRSAPEIDLFEAQVDRTKGGHVSQSGQWAVSTTLSSCVVEAYGIFRMQPFNAGMRWFNSSETLIIYDEDVTELNSYWGGSGQQTTSCVSLTSMSFFPSFSASLTDLLSSC